MANISNQGDVPLHSHHFYFVLIFPLTRYYEGKKQCSGFVYACEENYFIIVYLVIEQQHITRLKQVNQTKSIEGGIVIKDFLAHDRVNE